MNVSFPRPSFALVVATQLVLGALFIVGVGALVFLPGFSTTVAVSLPEYADLQTPLLALVIAITVLAMMTLAIVAGLVNRIHRGTMLAHSSLLLVDAIITSLMCGVVLISNEQAGSPFIALIHAMACLALLALACITVVLRSLLRYAILLRDELNEVV
jgi:hypothetical protein